MGWLDDDALLALLQWPPVSEMHRLNIRLNCASDWGTQRALSECPTLHEKLTIYGRSADDLDVPCAIKGDEMP